MLHHAVPFRLAPVVAFALTAAACATQPPAGVDIADGGGSPPAGEIVAMVFGKGGYQSAPDARVTFVFDAERTADGRASGYFRFHGAGSDGLVDLSGTVDCLALDSATGRAWIGGRISANRSAAGASGPAALPVGTDVGLIVEDATATGAASVSYPVALKDGAGTGAFCADRLWRRDTLVRVDDGTLGVFP